MQKQRWSKWSLFPDPRQRNLLTAPFGPGCYELRHISGELVLFGMGSHVAQRLTSLLPAPLGSGTRNNKAKRGFILKHLNSIQYRTYACNSVAQAKALECKLKKRKSEYRFNT